MIYERVRPGIRHVYTLICINSVFCDKKYTILEECIHEIQVGRIPNVIRDQIFTPPQTVTFFPNRFVIIFLNKMRIKTLLSCPVVIFCYLQVFYCLSTQFTYIHTYTLHTGQNHYLKKECLINAPFQNLRTLINLL